MQAHFNDQGPLAHVIEKRLQGMKETHGTELAGHLSSGLDALRETALLLLLVSLLITNFSIFIAVALSLIAWKIGRSAWLGWSRLERWHRLIEQEKYEIEHHRPQEREELVALYSQKGFSGKLLDDVVSTLMADQDRLLKVMLEEEMGLTLEAYEHPLKQAAGAGLGALLSAIIMGVSLFFFPKFGPIVSGFTLVGIGGGVAAGLQENKIIAAVVWNVSLAILSYGILFFLGSN